MNSMRALLCLAATGLGYTAMPGIALAQEARVIEEIVVTARKRAESLQDVPVAVSAFSQEALENQSIQEFVDLEAQIPSVDIQMIQSDPTIAAISIRGQSQADALLTTDSSVGVYVDGISLPRQAGLNANMFDIERIEVLKGPQGTLYGRNTTGGAINVITRKPDYDGMHGYVRGSFGNESFTRFEGAVNIPISETAAARFGVAKTDADGWGESNFTGNDLYDQDELFVRGSLMFEPTDRINILFQSDYLDIDEGGATEKLVQPGGNLTNGLPLTSSIEAGIELGALNPADIPSALNPVPGPTFVSGITAGYNAMLGYTQGSLLETDSNADVYSEATLWGAGLTVTFDITDTLQFKSVSGYRDWETDRLLDLDGTPFTILHPRLFVDADVFSQEFQLSGINGPLNWVVGTYYSKEEGTDGSRTLSVIALNPTRNITEGFVTNTSWAVFGQGTYQVTDALDVTLGVRWTEEKKELTNMNRLALTATGMLIACRVPPGNLPIDQCAADSTDTFSDPSWLASVDYDFNDRVMMYASIARGFRGGGQNLRADGADLAAAQPFEPETATSYEVGLKGDFADSRIRLNAAYYFTDYEDIQRSIIVPGAATGSVVTVLTNAAEAEISGWEVETWLYPTPNLSLFFTVGTTDFEYKDFSSLAADGVTIVNRTGEGISVPDWKASLSTRWDTMVGENQLGFQVDYSYQDDHSMDHSSQRQDAVTQEGFGLLNARIDFELANGIKFSLWGKNLQDEEYISDVTDFTGNLGPTISVVGRPRSYGLTVSKNFGDE